MQNKKMKIAVLKYCAVPQEVLAEAGIREGELLQFTARKGKIIIESVTDIEDYVCDKDCQNCPVYTLTCGGKYKESEAKP